jgi:hypothetical protein
MSAMTVSVAEIHGRAHQPENRLGASDIARRRAVPSSGGTTQAIQPCTIVRATTPPAEWRLTDRGIAVVMVLAATILTVALAVIGLTAVRVTSDDPGADVHKSQVDPR